MIDIIISGCPRSGTSMMTNTVGELLADDGYTIIGEQFPQERRYNNMALDTNEQRDGESDHRYKLRMFLTKRMQTNGRNTRNLERQESQRKKKSEAMTHVKKMNPHGFYECRYTVQGCYYHWGIEKIIEGKRIAKIVSQGLVHTDPAFLGEKKIIMMTRNPREVAKSQEDLQHSKEIQEIMNIGS